MALESWRVPGDLLNFVYVAVIKVVLSLIVTEFAWRAVEQPILGLKRHFSPPGERPVIARESAPQAREG